MTFVLSNTTNVLYYCTCAYRTALGYQTLYSEKKMGIIVTRSFVGNKCVCSRASKRFLYSVTHRHSVSVPMTRLVRKVENIPYLLGYAHDTWYRMYHHHDVK